MNDERTNPELRSLLGREEYTRRDILVTTLAIGFAAAVQPVSAETIHTDSKGLVDGEVRIPVKDGEVPAYRARPDRNGPFPIVLVVQEIFGVHEHIKDLCRRFAKQGYLAIAVELYARQGDVSKMTDFKEILSKVVSKVPDEQVMSDLDAAVAWAQKSGEGDPKRTGITGFCWGGRQVWLYTEQTPGVRAAAAWYGPLDSPGKSPIALAAGAKGRVIGFYGGKDAGITAEQVAKMRAALAAAGAGDEGDAAFERAGHGDVLRSMWMVVRRGRRRRS
jgi:carboxymethylenebutenolidase